MVTFYQHSPDNILTSHNINMEKVNEKTIDEMFEYRTVHSCVYDGMMLMMRAYA